MNRFVILPLMLGVFGFSSCMVHLDRPPIRTITGRVVDADTGQGISNAIVRFSSDRKSFALLLETFGCDASARTDQKGNYSVVARLKDKVRVSVWEENHVGGWFNLPPFPRSNRLEYGLWKLSPKSKGACSKL